MRGGEGLLIILEESPSFPLPLKMWVVSRVWLDLKVGDRYSKTTIHHHTDTDKTPATSGDTLPSLRAIAD